MSIFSRKKKPASRPVTREELLKSLKDDPSSLECFPKTDPGFKSATALVNHTLKKLDETNEEKKLLQKSARRITQTIRDMDLHWKMPKKA
jgi:hypothetical protein